MSKELTEKETEELQLKYSKFTLSIIEDVHKTINNRLIEEPDQMTRALILNRVIGNIAIGFYKMNINFTSDELAKRDQRIQEKLKKEKNK